jgi:hypothetical protein
MTDRPMFHAYTVRKYKKLDGAEDAFWTKIGAVFAHRDGKGYDVVLDCLPVDGRISIREPRDKDQNATAAAA